MSYQPPPPMGYGQQQGYGQPGYNQGPPIPYGQPGYYDPNAGMGMQPQPMMQSNMGMAQPQMAIGGSYPKDTEQMPLNIVCPFCGQQGDTQVSKMCPCGTDKTKLCLCWWCCCPCACVAWCLSSKYVHNCSFCQSEVMRRSDTGKN